MVKTLHGIGHVHNMINAQVISSTLAHTTVLAVIRLWAMKVIQNKEYQQCPSEDLEQCAMMTKVERKSVRILSPEGNISYLIYYPPITV
jgi:hypothetical protein